MLKTHIQPNISSTLNVQEIITLTKLQQEGRIPLVQMIYSYLVMMTCTKAMTPIVLDNI